MYSKLSQSGHFPYFKKLEKRGKRCQRCLYHPPIYASGSEAPYVHALCWVLHPNQKMQNADFTKLPKDMHCRLDM